MDGLALKNAIKNAGYTQARIAELLQVNPVTVSRWIAGDRDPKDDVKLKLSKLLNVPIQDLMSAGSINTSIINTGVNNGTMSMKDVINAHQLSPASERATNTSETTSGFPLRSAEILRREDFYMIPILNEAGQDSGRKFPFPIPDEEYLYGASLESLFALKIHDSMMEQYLFDGDYAVCERTEKVSPGQLVACVMYGSCIVRGIRNDSDGNIKLLVVGNKAFSDTEIDGSNHDQLTVLGRVMRIYRPSIAPGVLM